MDIVREQIIWHPGYDYDSRPEEEWTQPISGLSLEVIVELVQRRASEDGEYCIENNMVGKDGENEPKMRDMMAFVSDPKHIEQAVDFAYKAQTEKVNTVDYICRDLAQASKWAIAVKNKKK